MESGHGDPGGSLSATTAPRPTVERAAGSRRLAMLRGLALDAGLPVATYYALHLLGASDWVGLLAGSGVAAARIAWTAARTRQINAFATVMLVIYGVGFALAFLTDDPRMMFLRSSFVTASVGIVFLVTAALGRRPLTLAALQGFDPETAGQAQHRYDTGPDVRRRHRLSSTVWGLCLLAEALVRVPLVYLMPIEIAVAASESMSVGVFLLLLAWTWRYLAVGDVTPRHPREHLNVPAA